MSAWFNYHRIGQILVAGLILGAGLPALFSLGVRLNAEGVGVAEHGGTVAQKNPALVAAELGHLRRGARRGDRRRAVHRP